MADFSGIRPWLRGLASKIAASTASLGAGELLVDEQGNVYGGNGGLLSALKRLVRVDEVTTAVQSYVSSLVVTNTSLTALATESGYYWALTDSAGRIAVGVKVDGTFTGPKLVVPDATVSLSKLTTDVQAGVQLPLPVESGYVWALIGSGNRVAMAVTADGSLYVPKLALTAGSVGLAALAPAVQAGLLGTTPVESGWAFTVTDANGEIGGGWRLDGSFEAKVRKPLDHTRTTLDTASYVVIGDVDQTNQTHRLRIVRKSDGQMFRVGAPTSNAIDPRLSADGTKLLFRTDAPYSPLLLDRPNNGFPLGKPAKIGTWRNVSVPIDGSSNVLTAITSIDEFIMVGDSLSNGTNSSVGGGYGPFLETLTGLPGYNYGIGGQTSPQIAGRFNSPSATMTVTGNSIPTSGPVALTAISVALAHNSTDFGSSRTGTLAGVHGTLTYTASSADAASAYSFTADPGLLSAPAACSPGSSFVTDIGAQYREAITILWLGRNNAVSPAPENDTAACVAYLSPIAKRFVVLSILTGSGEGTGSGPYTNISTINANLAAAYPANYIDVRKGLVGGSGGLTAQALWPGGPVLPSALSYNGLTPTAQDLTDCGSDTVPTQLRIGDVIHLDDFGYQFVAYAISQFMLAKGWL